MENYSSFVEAENALSQVIYFQIDGTYDTKFGAFSSVSCFLSKEIKLNFCNIKKMKYAMLY